MSAFIAMVSTKAVHIRIDLLGYVLNPLIMLSLFDSQAYVKMLCHLAFSWLFFLGSPPTSVATDLYLYF